ncbi:MAG: hypothetical protein J0G32_07345 [Alphaproteobacteria bacterium]|nr:hypothetical protein [Alphaproteobacteria bacterium]OJV14180.1 MAG: hypothetical protein BGO27_01620 [Alphaproteobacteria bacterium 33-17]
MEKKHTALYDYTTRTEFEKIINHYKLNGFDYFAFSEHDPITHVNRYIMSDKDWMKEYDENLYSLNDPVRNSAISIAPGISLFKEMPVESKEAEHIMQRRDRYSIYNGVIIIKDINDNRFQLTMATSTEKFNTLKELDKYKEEIHFLMQDLENLPGLALDKKILVTE